MKCFIVKFMSIIREILIRMLEFYDTIIDLLDINTDSNVSIQCIENDDEIEVTVGNLDSTLKTFKHAIKLKTFKHIGKTSLTCEKIANTTIKLALYFKSIGIAREIEIMSQV